VINEKVNKRYDFIYSTSQVGIIVVRNLLEDSIRGTSHHALVIADFEIS
jgi:hypothetical protein